MNSSENITLEIKFPSKFQKEICGQKNKKIKDLKKKNEVQIQVNKTEDWVTLEVTGESTQVKNVEQLILNKTNNEAKSLQKTSDSKSTNDDNVNENLSSDNIENNDNTNDEEDTHISHLYDTETFINSYEYGGVTIPVGVDESKPTDEQNQIEKPQENQETFNVSSTQEKPETKKEEQINTVLNNDNKNDNHDNNSNSKTDSNDINNNNDSSTSQEITANKDNIESQIATEPKGIEETEKIKSKASLLTPEPSSKIKHEVIEDNIDVVELNADKSLNLPQQLDNNKNDNIDKDNNNNAVSGDNNNNNNINNNNNDSDNKNNNDNDNQESTIIKKDLDEEKIEKQSITSQHSSLGNPDSLSRDVSISTVAIETPNLKPQKPPSYLTRGASNTEKIEEGKENDESDSMAMIVSLIGLITIASIGGYWYYKRKS